MTSAPEHRLVLWRLAQAPDATIDTTATGSPVARDRALLVVVSGQFR